MPIRYPDPPGYVPDVMTKVYRALEDAGLDEDEVHYAISEMQTEGVLFRDRNEPLDVCASCGEKKTKKEQ